MLPASCPRFLNAKTVKAFRSKKSKGEHFLSQGSLAFSFKPWDSSVNQLLECRDRKGELQGNISNTRDSVSSGYPNTEKGVESSTRSGIVLKKFEVLKTEE